MIEACPFRTSGDIQLEVVLSLMLMNQNDGPGEDPMKPMVFRGMRVLDFGCGKGSLLSALRTFSPAVLPFIEYVGVDQNRDALEFAATKGELQYPWGPDLATSTPLSKALRSVRFIPAEAFPSALPDESYDMIHVVNVLHHLHPVTDLPEFLNNALGRLTWGGFLVFEDLFLGDYPVDLHVPLYGCPGAVYLGPAELSSIFYLPTGCPGCYRYFRKERPGATGRVQYWFGFTYVLKKGIRISSFPWAEAFLPGLVLALKKMTNQAQLAQKRKETTSGAASAQDETRWYQEYTARLEKVLSVVDEKRVKEALRPFVMNARDNPAQAVEHSYDILNRY